MSEHEHEGTEHDVNTDAGFAALMAEKVGRPLSPEQVQSGQDGDRTVATGLTYEESPQPQRDERGRFAPTAPTPAEGQEAPEAPSEDSPHVDPALAALVEKHGGDVSAALADAWEQQRNAQTLIGRQSSEVEEARRAARENEELRERLARLEGRLESVPQRSTPPVLITDEQLGDLFADAAEKRQGGQAMTWIIDNAPDLIDQAFDHWAEVEPGPALRWRSRYDLSMAEWEKSQQAPPSEGVLPEADREFLAQQRAVAQTRSTLDTVEKQIIEKEGAPMWEAIKPHLVGALESAPEFIRKAVVSTDPATQQGGIEALAALAKGSVVATATNAAQTAVNADLEAKKRAASVVATGSLTPAGARQPGAPASEEEESAERIKRFKEALMNESTTSVASGLTYGTA